MTDRSVGSLTAGGRRRAGSRETDVAAGKSGSTEGAA